MSGSGIENGIRPSPTPGRWRLRRGTAGLVWQVTKPSGSIAVFISWDGAWSYIWTVRNFQLRREQDDQRIRMATHGGVTPAAG